MDATRRLADLDEILRQRLRRAGARTLALRVVLEWNPRLRSTAGRAWCRQDRIELNPSLLRIEGGSRALLRTALHEAAHLLAFARFPRRRMEPHGLEWQQACIDLGIPGESATHRLPLPRREVARRLHYRCDHCGLVVARVRPLRRASACALCCRAHAQNHYDPRFVLRRMICEGG